MWESFVDLDICHQMVSLRKLLCDLDLLLESKKIKNVSIADTVKDSAKMHRTLTDLEICQRIIPLHIMTMTYFLNITKIEVLASRKQSELAQACEITLNT